MANKPKEKKIVRTNPFSGNQKTITKSKTIDAQGTVTKKRTVTRGPVLTDWEKLSSEKSKIKQKFASGVTRKVKTASSTENRYRQPGKDTFNREDRTTTQKEKISGPGLVNKVKSLAKPSHKQGRSSTSYGGKFYGESKISYGSAKRNIGNVVKRLKKG
jgi:hypothetical protein